MQVTTRYYAAAAAAAGLEDRDRGGGRRVHGRATCWSTAEGATLASRSGLDSCSLLRDGLALKRGHALLADGDTVDVVPPFAGG